MPEPSHKKSMAWMRYAGLATQMIVSLLIGGWLGTWIDTRMNNEKPICTAAIIMLILLGIFYKLYKDLTRP